MTQVEEPFTNAPTAKFVERYVDADGFHIRYQESGEGEPLVCLHGAGGMRISRSHAVLAEHRRVIVFEVPGFGASPANERSSSIQDLASTMHEAVANLGIERFNLMGNSFGGRLALWMAILRPDPIQALVLAAPAAIRPEGTQRSETPAADRLGLLYAHPERQPPRPPPDPAVLAKQEALLQRVGSPPRDPDLDNRLGTMNVPTLVLFGTLDRAIPSEMGRTYREKLPNCHFILMYDAGHALDADRPEAFASVATDFLERREGFIVSTQSSLIYP